MAGSIKNLRTTSESHVFQQVLRKNATLARQATRDRDPMAVHADRGIQEGATSVILLDAVLRGYDPNRLFTDPVVPFLVQFVSISPNHGSADGGTTVTVEVDDSSSVTELKMNNVALTDFTIVDSTHVRGVTPEGDSGSASLEILNVFGTTTVNDAYTYG